MRNLRLKKQFQTFKAIVAPFVLSAWSEWDYCTLLSTIYPDESRAASLHHVSQLASSRAMEISYVVSFRRL